MSQGMAAVWLWCCMDIGLFFCPCQSAFSGITSYHALSMSFHNQPQYPFETLQINGIKMHRVQESDHERAQIEKTKNVRARCSRNPSASGGQWLSMMGICCDMLRLIWYDQMIGCMENTQMWFMFLQIINPIYYIESALVIIDSCQVEFAPGLWAQLEWLLFHHVSPRTFIQSDSVEAQCRDCLLPTWIMWAQSVGPDVIWINLGLSGMAGAAKRDTSNVRTFSLSSWTRWGVKSAHPAHPKVAWDTPTMTGCTYQIKKIFDNII